MSRSSGCSWWNEIRQFEGAMTTSSFGRLFLGVYLICSMKEVVQGLRITADIRDRNSEDI